MSHPIPQELRDRFDQIERDIMGNKMERGAVFTQMRTAVQAHFQAHADPFTGGAAHDPVFAHLAHCNGCIVCESWRKALLPESRTQSPKCDGNHGGPKCADPECWNGGEPVSAGLTWEAQGEPNQYMLFKDGKWFAVLQMNGEQWLAEQESFFASIATPHRCTVPPAGWTCSRRAGHSGPCAATPIDDDQRPQ